MPPYAYVAAYIQDSLTIIDMANPAAPVTVGHIAGAGAPNYLNYAAEVYVLGDYAYVGAVLEAGLTILNVANPLAPTFVGHRFVGGEPRGVFVRRISVTSQIIAYVASYISNAFHTLDCSNPAAPVLLDTIAGAGAPNYLDGARDVQVVGNYAFVTAMTDQCVSIFDVSNPAAITYVTRFAGIPFGLYNPMGLIYQNDLMYVCSSGNPPGWRGRVSVVDVSDPTTPVLRDFVENLNLDGAEKIYVLGNHAYVVSPTLSMMAVVDVTNPAAIFYVTSFGGWGPPNWCGGARDVWAEGNYAYVAAYDNDSVTVVDITNPAAPLLHGNIRGAGAPNWLDGAFAIAPYLNPYTLPVVQTDPATEVEATTATLKGTLQDDGGEACDCGFEWGETEAYGNTTPTQSKTTGQTFAQVLTGLASGITYHFRAFATNSAGTSYGADRAFTTKNEIRKIRMNKAYALSREEL